MNLNKYIAAGLLATVAAGFTSCSDDFLEEKYTTGYSVEFFETSEGIQSLTLSLYNSVRWIGGYETQGYNAFMGGTDEFGIGTDMANEMWQTYDPRMAPLWTTVNGNTGTNAQIWDNVYYGVNSANTIIARADKVPDEAIRKNCLAQAYLYRGFSYYLLTSQFGHCVLQTEPTKGIVRSFPNTTPQQCWEQIIADLEQAYNLFDGESNNLAGKGVSWTKATAAHFLAKACLFAASERNDDWNSDKKREFLEKGLSAANYAIGARKLEPNVIDLYGNWTGPNCAIEQSDEILMCAPQDQNFGGRTNVRNAGAFFNPQFSNFANNVLGGQRGCITGGKDFQRFRPTEYTLAAFDNVNDARLWKSFGTVYGSAVEYKGAKVKNNGEIWDEKAELKDGEYIANEIPATKIGDPAVIFIINKKSEHKYDKFTFGSGRYQPLTNFVDEEGRLAEYPRKQTRDGEVKFAPAGHKYVNSWILYKNGEFVGDTFGDARKAGPYGSWGCNMYPGVIKHSCGYLNAFAGDNNSRDIVLARLGETYLVRAEIKVRLGDYAGAKEDIDALRRRGAWHAGENRAYYVDGNYEAAIASTQLSNDARKQANEGWNLGTNSYYISNPDVAPTTASTEAEMTNWSWTSLPAEDEAILSKLGVSSQFDRAINFILNEHTRELVGEFVRWEALSRTKTIENRALKLNKDMNPDVNPGVCQFDPKKHYLRPIPQSFLDQMQNPDGTNLSDADKAAWQNPGYYTFSDWDIK